MNNDKWRKPDAYTKTDLTEQAIWYSVGGVNGDYATEVEKVGANEYGVREYVNVEGMIEDYDKENPFLCTATTVTAQNIYDAVKHGIRYLGYFGGSESFVSELPQ